MENESFSPYHPCSNFEDYLQSNPETIPIESFSVSSTTSLLPLKEIPSSNTIITLSSLLQPHQTNSSKDFATLISPTLSPNSSAENSKENPRRKRYWFLIPNYEIYKEDDIFAFLKLPNNSGFANEIQELAYSPTNNKFQIKDPAFEHLVKELEKPKRPLLFVHFKAQTYVSTIRAKPYAIEIMEFQLGNTIPIPSSNILFQTFAQKTSFLNIPMPRVKKAIASDDFHYIPERKRNSKVLPLQISVQVYETAQDSKTFLPIVQSPQLSSNITTAVDETAQDSKTLLQILQSPQLISNIIAALATNPLVLEKVIIPMIGGQRLSKIRQNIADVSNPVFWHIKSHLFSSV